jgi:hypothetical protein
MNPWLLMLGCVFSAELKKPAHRKMRRLFRELLAKSISLDSSLSMGSCK